jgi:hypothetical protein
VRVISPTEVQLYDTEQHAIDGGGTGRANLTSLGTGTHHTLGKAKLVEVGPWDETDGWGTTTTYSTETETVGFKQLFKNSINASRSIDIQFIGYDADAALAADRPYIQVLSKGDVIINGGLTNHGGTTTLTSSQGRIELVEGALHTVGGVNINLNAASGIGADGAIRTNLTNNAGGVLNAISGSGDVNIVETSGALTVDEVKTSKTNGEVTLTAFGNLNTLDSTSVVQGSAVALTSLQGDIGVIDGLGAIDGAAAKPFRIDMGNSADNSALIATAQGDINIRETSGNLFVDKVVSQTGDVRLEIASGALIDVNTDENRDPRTEEQLLRLWQKMRATADAAQQSIDATIEAYENVITSSYHSYWKFRLQQGDPSVYDATFRVTLSTAERSFYAQYYADQGMSSAQVDAAITTLENKRTVQYHTLHQTYGDIGNIATGNAYSPDVYDANFAYETWAPTAAFGAGAVGPDSSIDLGEHQLSHGQVVVYHNGGGTSIGGLVDGQRYYVVVDDAERAFSASAVSAGKIDLGAGHGLEDGDKVIYRKANATDIAIGGLADELMYVVDVDAATRTWCSCAA